LWEQLKEKLPCKNKWIICGDWNMVERKKDKAFSCKDIIFDRKKLAQNSFDKLAIYGSERTCEVCQKPPIFTGQA